MKQILIGILLCFNEYLVNSSKALAQDCTENRIAYQQLAPQLLIHSREDALRLTPEAMQSLTERVHDVLKQSTLSQLKLGRTNLKIESYLRCVQDSPEIENWQELTNAPQVIQLDGIGPRLLVSYWIMRGGAAIPTIKPFLDVYRRTGTAWEYEESHGEEFVGSSFFVQTQHTKDDGNVVLISGFHIGDPETPFRIEVLGAKDSKLLRLYLSPLMARTRIVKISPEKIFLEQSDTHVGVPFPPLPGTLEKEQDPLKSEIHRSTLYFSDILNQ